MTQITHFRTSHGVVVRVYLKLKTWVSPEELSELSLDEIVVQLKSQTSVQTVEIAERYRFFKRLQRDGKSAVEYMSQLEKTCKFDSYLDTAFRDQIVCGLKDQRIQQKLLCIRELENPTAEGKPEDAAAHRVFTSKKSSCYRCGEMGHLASTCFHKD